MFSSSRFVCLSLFCSGGWRQLTGLAEGQSHFPLTRTSKISRLSSVRRVASLSKGRKDGRERGTRCVPWGLNLRLSGIRDEGEDLPASRFARSRRDSLDGPNFAIAQVRAPLRQGQLWRLLKFFESSAGKEIFGRATVVFCRGGGRVRKEEAESLAHAAPSFGPQFISALTSARAEAGVLVAAWIPSPPPLCPVCFVACPAGFSGDNSERARVRILPRSPPVWKTGRLGKLGKAGGKWRRQTRSTAEKTPLQKLGYFLLLLLLLLRTWFEAVSSVPRFSSAVWTAVEGGRRTEKWILPTWSPLPFF